MKHFLLRTGLLLVACDCTPPLPPPRITAAPPPSASSAPALTPAPTIDTALVSVTAALRPPTLVLDGDLTEWGSLLPPSEPAPLPASTNLPRAAEEDAAPAPPPPSGPNPASAPSHLVLALGNDAVTIAAELGEPARDGIWFGIGSRAPDVLPIGLFARGGRIEPFDCDFEQVYMFEEGFKKGKPNPPEVVAACRGLLARHAELVARHGARFTRVFKLDRDGVRGANADGTLFGIEGAKAVFKPGPRGAMVEAVLPLAAMPRLDEAPLVSLRLVARAATGPKPELLPAQWVRVRLPAPVSFEPFGAIRDHSFQRLRGLTSRAPGISYHPGDPLHVESMHYSDKAASVVAREEALYSKPIGRVGKFEVGYVSAYVPWLAIFEKGKLIKEAKLTPREEYGGYELNVDEFDPAEPRGVVTRDGELHVFSYLPLSFSPNLGPRWPSWSVLAIAPDGSVHDAIEAAELPVLLAGTTAFISPDRSTFGLRGPTPNPDSRAGAPPELVTEVAWKWDSPRKKYVGKRRSMPVPAPSKGAVK